MAVSPNPVLPKWLTNLAQLIVARSYWAGEELRLPPELTALEDDKVNPAGKYDWGSSTVCSWVPVSCPDACGTGAVTEGAEAVAELAALLAALAPGVVGVAYGVPLVAHPVTAASTPATERTASTLGTDDTALPNPIRTLILDNVPFHVRGPHVARRPTFGIMTLEHPRSPTAASG
jgi:hypothetical protein